MAVPMVMYGSENWVLNRSERRRIETNEMKFLRRVAGLNLLDQVNNNYIRNSLEIFNLNERIIENKERCHAHIQRMDPNRLTQKLLNYRPQRYRDVGRPRIRWKDALTREWYGQLSHEAQRMKRHLKVDKK
ncbi:hypothetical protein C0J52_05026 [Blattella germanica]|nr:hypothetical protein C0J52_05026 [Blattella germanica]